MSSRRLLINRVLLAVCMISIGLGVVLGHVLVTWWNATLL
jgi:hypothetical protein